MEELGNLHNKAVLLEPPLRARCGRSPISIEKIGPSSLTATHLDQISVGQTRVLAIPSAEGPVIIPCRIIRSQVTDWRDEETGRFLYRSVFEFFGLTGETQRTFEQLLSDLFKPTSTA